MGDATARVTDTAVRTTADTSTLPTSGGSEARTSSVYLGDGG
jgi:hypothetical protein